MSGDGGVVKSEVASSIPTDSGLSVQEELNTLDAVALPGFDFGRSGNAPSGSWLSNNQVPSNIVGIPIGMATPVITEIWVGNENINTFDISIYEHDGDEVNLTLLTTVSIIATRTQTFTVSIAATNGKQMAVRTATGSSKNPKVYVLVKGTV